MRSSATPRDDRGLRKVLSLLVSLTRGTGNPLFRGLISLAARRTGEEGAESPGPEAGVRGRARGRQPSPPCPDPISLASWRPNRTGLFTSSPGFPEPIRPCLGPVVGPGREVQGAVGLPVQDARPTQMLRVSPRRRQEASAEGGFAHVASGASGKGAG